MVEEKRFFFRQLNTEEVIEVGTEAMAALARPMVEQMAPEVVYVVTIQGPKVKRTITGHYVSHDLTEVVLLDEQGKFKRVPIDRIIRINYYNEAPF